jgi:hypothetical protein
MNEPALVSTRQWSRTISKWLGLFEIIVGCALIPGGCLASFANGASLAFVIAVLGFVIGVFGLILPGMWLRTASSFRWAGQVLPVLAVTWFLRIFLHS